MLSFDLLIPLFFIGFPFLLFYFAFLIFKDDKNKKDTND